MEIQWQTWSRHRCRRQGDGQSTDHRHSDHSVLTSKAVVDEINKQTATFNGMQVPVRIEVDDKKNFVITVGIPPTTALIKKEVNIEKGSAEPNLKTVGDLPMEAAVRIARMKRNDMLSYDLKHAVKEVVGTCVSMGVSVDGRRPKEVLAAIDAGTYDAVLRYK
jgi:large subunit ribosomal protein L11